MARITPTSSIPAVNLEDDEPYVGTLASIDSGEGEYGPQLILDWDLGDSSSIRDWVGFSIGLKKGMPSKLRQLCNALSDRPALDEVSFFDDESYEWGYQGAEGPADNKLTEGMQVTFLGATVQKKDGSGPRFAIQKYKQLKRTKPAAKPKLVRPVSEEDPDDIPF